MSILVRADGTWGDDTTRVVRDAATQTFVAGDVVPLAAYLALAPARRAVQLATHVGALALIAVDFPAFKDGRGFSAATLLRSRYGFRGDLRAIGDVVTDVLFYMRRVGFSSFALRADQDTAAAVAALGSFTDSYQASVDQPLPYFRRRAAPAGVAP
jgi:uncharacterized protein (DUF934 family)